VVDPDETVFIHPGEADAGPSPIMPPPDVMSEPVVMPPPVMMSEPVVMPPVVTQEPIIVTLEPISEVSPGSPAQPAPPPARSVAGTLARVVLSIVFGILGFAFICVFIILTVLRPGNFTAIIERMDVTWILEETGLGDEIIRGINESAGFDRTVDIFDIEEFLRRDAVSGEVGRVAERYVRAITEGDLGYHMTARDIASFVRAIAPDIRDQFDHRLTNEDFDMIVNTLEDHVDLREFRVGTLIEAAEIDVSLPFALFSIYPLIIIGILCALIIFDIFLLHRKRIRSAFLAAGIPIALAGLLFIAASLLFGAFPSLLGTGPLSEITRFTGGIAFLLLIRGLICFIAGILFIVVNIIINGVMKGKPPKIHQAGGSKAWRLTGLITNSVLLIAAAVTTLLFHQNIPI
jgi:hypothetical protein